VAATTAVVWGLTAVQVVDSPWITAMIAIPGMIAIALYAWHAGEKTRNFDTEEWKGGAVFTPLLGCVFFAIDVFIGSTHGHYDSFFQAAFHAGSPFGIVLTMLVCPIGTTVCMGGWVRCSILERFGPEHKVDD
jgi:hypothetical protein